MLKIAVAFNPFTPESDLIDFTLSNARRFYSLKGDPLGLKGLETTTRQRSAKKPEGGYKENEADHTRSPDSSPVVSHCLNFSPPVDSRFLHRARDDWGRVS